MSAVNRRTNRAGGSTSRPRVSSTDINVTGPVGRAQQPYLLRMLRRAAPLVPKAPSELSVALVGDEQMSQLHVQFMNIAGPTDVLTFELDHDSKGRVVSGEVIVCVPEARRRAKELGHQLEHELLLYALHGLLHLSGHDDRTDSSYRRMHRTEDRILTQLGVGSVFAVKADSRGRKKR